MKKKYKRKRWVMVNNLKPVDLIKIGVIIALIVIGLIIILKVAFMFK